MPKLEASGVSICAPSGRTLIRDLNMCVGRERVAIVGRNGVGKSTLLATLAGHLEAASGRLLCDGSRFLAPQELPDGRGSGGERRRAVLAEAFQARADFLLLDEPSEDLDARSTRWLLDRLQRAEGGLLVVSHAPVVLKQFSDFFVVTEAGCRYVRGEAHDILASLERENERKEERYRRRLRTLEQEERRSDIVARRRQRKKQVGRVREVGRAPARALLNSKRSYAQESQGKRAVLGRQRIAQKRSVLRAAQKTLERTLPLAAVMPTLDSACDGPHLIARDLEKWFGGRCLFRDISLDIARDRLAITGPNGSGKTTLLEVLVGKAKPTSGTVSRNKEALAFIGQGAPSWMLPESLLECMLWRDGTDLHAALERIAAHRFPLGLAERPLQSLSPGERFRAALIGLMSRSQVPELLLLDEPTRSLDRAGTMALGDALCAWPGGLLIASHNESFLQRVGLDRSIELSGPQAT